MKYSVPLTDYTLTKLSEDILLNSGMFSNRLLIVFRYFSSIAYYSSLSVSLLCVVEYNSNLTDFFGLYSNPYDSYI